MSKAAGDTRFLGSAKIIAACTLLSRFTGLARDIIMNRAFGQGWVKDAFDYGFQIPNLFRRLFGEGALAAVFVPVFTEVLDKKGRPAAWLLLGRVAGLLTLVLSLIVILVEATILVLWIVLPGEPMRLLQMGLTALMMPFMVSICLLALFSAILNCIHHFTVPALLPIVLNLMQIVGVELIGPMLAGPDQLERRIYGPALAILATGLLQIAIILPVLRKHGVTFRMSLDRSDPDMKRIMRPFIPIMLGQSILLFNVFLDAQICTFLTRGPTDPPTKTIFGYTFDYPLEAGALATVTNAQRLYQFPLGVLAISLATAAFPMFSLYASRGQFDNLRDGVARSLRIAVFEGLPAGLMLIILAEPIIALLFERGLFGSNDTERAARVLRWYAIGIAAFCMQQIVIRVFYSLKDTMTPMWIACGLAVVNEIINLSLVWDVRLREAVFGLSTSVTATINVAIAFWILRKRLGGRMGARSILSSFVKTAVCTAAAGVAAYFTLRLVAPLTDGMMDVRGFTRFAAKLIRVAGPLAAAIALFIAVSWGLRMEELGWIFKGPKKTTGGPTSL